MPPELFWEEQKKRAVLGSFLTDSFQTFHEMSAVFRDELVRQCCTLHVVEVDKRLIGVDQQDVDPIQNSI